jgi:hypothetical protein
MMEAICSSETSVLTRVGRLSNPEDDILQTELMFGSSYTAVILCIQMRSALTSQL